MSSDTASTSYGDIHLDEAAPDLLVSDSPSQLSARHQHHHHPHHQQQYPSPHQQRLPSHDQQFVTTSSVTYVTQPSNLYNAISTADAHGSFEYANHVVPDLISQPASEMRTGPGGGGRVDGAGAGKRERKRKREDKNEDVHHQTKMDASQRCDVCGEQGSGHYFGALVCLPCKVSCLVCLPCKVR